MTAAVVSAILLIGTLVLCSISLNNERNEEILSSMDAVCEYYKDIGSPLPEEESFTALMQYLEAQQIRAVILDGEGSTLFSTSKADAVTAGDLYLTKDSEIYYIGRSRGMLYTGVESPRGHALVISHRQYNVYTSGTLSSWLFWIFLILSLGLLAYVTVVAERQRRAMFEVMNALDSFADGHFERRFTVSDGLNAEIAEEFNRTLDSVNKRVFDQRTRNFALASALNHIVNGVMTINENGIIEFINVPAKKLLGISGTVIGKPYSGITEHVKLEEVFAGASSARGVYTTEVAAYTGVGRSKRVLRLFISQLNKDGKPAGALALIEDITRVRDLEQQRTDFAAAVSHELKTPLTSISGFLETLLDGAVDDPNTARRFLTIIKAQSDRLQRLINDILTVSKLESGTEERPKTLLNFDSLVRFQVDTLQVQAKAKNLKLSYNPPEEHVQIFENRDYIEQIVINLVENAVKYNDKADDAWVVVQVMHDEDNAYFSVSDNGLGIPPEHLPRIFEKFYRVDKGRSREMGGTGLGLAITKEIIDSIGGSIEVTSKPGEGTEFMVTLPLAKETDAIDDDMENA